MDFFVERPKWRDEISGDLGLGFRLANGSQKKVTDHCAFSAKIATTRRPWKRSQHPLRSHRTCLHMAGKMRLHLLEARGTRHAHTQSVLASDEPLRTLAFAKRVRATTITQASPQGRDSPHPAEHIMVLPLKGQQEIVPETAGRPRRKIARSRAPRLEPHAAVLAPVREAALLRRLELRPWATAPVLRRREKYSEKYLEVAAAVKAVCHL